MQFSVSLTYAASVPRLLHNDAADHLPPRSSSAAFGVDRARIDIIVEANDITDAPSAAVRVAREFAIRYLGSATPVAVEAVTEEEAVRRVGLRHQPVKEMQP